ncbi:hypothetical protein cand_021520 [Cryptosporidium andersoni]|uniref:Nuclear speckle splicing regulatory protein 1 N-terminal domain-containing protein n=1 Tax=Cryptosporidium andersoni TaxID=117008 RepID=A0A1J4MSG4_9CRYT|nr:hypothetical protein cand_021520 [Cryptosporidium andersoni]
MNKRDKVSFILRKSHVISQDTTHKLPFGDEFSDTEDKQGINELSQSTINEYKKAHELFKEQPELLDFDNEYLDLSNYRDPGLSKNSSKNYRSQNILESRYITKLQNLANRRKVERQLTQEKKLQREIENESSGVEIFITPSYRKVLEERKYIEDKISEENKLCEQKSLGNFSKHLFSMITERLKDESKKESSYNPSHMVDKESKAFCSIKEEENLKQEIDNKQLIIDTCIGSNLRADKRINEAQADYGTEEVSYIQIIRNDKIELARKRYLERKQNRQSVL